MPVKIEVARLRKLEHAEQILYALQSGGVDNWEGYTDAIAPLLLEEEIEELSETFLEEVEVLLLSNAYEPSERGAGHCSNDDDREQASVLLRQFLVQLDELKKNA